MKISCKNGSKLNDYKYEYILYKRLLLNANNYLNYRIFYQLNFGNILKSL